MKDTFTEVEIDGVMFHISGKRVLRAYAYRDSLPELYRGQWTPVDYKTTPCTNALFCDINMNPKRFLRLMIDNEYAVSEEDEKLIAACLY